MRGLVLQLVHDARGQLRPHPVRARDLGPVLRGDRGRQPVGRQDREDRQGHAPADALHAQQQPEPVALGRIDEAVEMDVVFAHMGLDQHAGRPARLQRL